ncbi:MAG: GatB/YqeY domain-containing protein [Polyangiaceae bacterium]|nr:GatB/YqeY domain-containing protein [Polyangiaceae bacterium]
MMIVKRGTLRLPVIGEAVAVPSAAHLGCPQCGQIVLRFQNAKRLGEDSIARYHKKHGLLSADGIRTIREQFNLTQDRLARLLRYTPRDHESELAPEAHDAPSARAWLSLAAVRETPRRIRGMEPRSWSPPEAIDMLLDEIKTAMFKAMKEGRTIEKEVLRVVVGEITTNAARPGMTGGDDEARAVIRKLIKSNEETLAASEDPTQRADLELENRTLTGFLPQSLSIEQIVAALDSVKDAIRSAGSDGQATGVAMKQLKASGAVVNGKDVSAAVRQMRA